MQKDIGRKLKLMFIAIVCVSLISTVYAGAIVNQQITENNISNIIVDNSNNNYENPRPSLLPPWLLSLFNGDWNYWSVSPDIFCIPNGDVGIGSDPEDLGKLVIRHDSTTTYPHIFLYGESHGDGPRITFNSSSDNYWTLFGSPNYFNIYSSNYGNIVQIRQSSPNNFIVNGDSRINGDIYVTGKGTFTHGIDPPYISFSKESHDTIREYAKDVEEHEEVMQFWNDEMHRMEVYVISEDAFYTLTGELVG